MYRKWRFLYILLRGRTQPAGNKSRRADAYRRMNIQTTRLELIPATAELFRLEASNPLALATPLHAAIPEDWPPEEVRGMLGFFADQMDAGVTGDGWGVYYWVTLGDDDAPRTLVGSGGFKSKPDGGSVEVGYGTHAEFQGRGYATEAVSALAQWALFQPGISVVVAEALPENVPSVRVLQNAGFAEVGPGEEAGTRRFEKKTA